MSGVTFQPELLRPDAVEYANVHQSREELQVYRNVSVASSSTATVDTAASLSTNVLLGSVQ